MGYDKFELRNKINSLYEQLQQSAATFILKPKEIEKIRENIYSLQEECKHEFKNGKCIYCRKEE